MNLNRWEAEHFDALMRLALECVESMRKEPEPERVTMWATMATACATVAVATRGS